MNPRTTIVSAIATVLLTPVVRAETLTLLWTDGAAIADLGEALAVLPAAPPGNPTVAGVSVDIDLTHPWIGDLIITLEHEGVEVRLVDRTGSANFPFACGGDDIAATFEDAAVTTPEDLCWPGAAPTITGLVHPVDQLGAFTGSAADGDWTVRVTDASLYDAGTVNGVTVRIELAPPAECVGDVTGDGLTNIADFNILAGNFGSAVTPDTGGDLTGDGVVNIADFNILAGDFGCGGVATPSAMKRGAGGALTAA